jgi:hypothetical protein
MDKSSSSMDHAAKNISFKDQPVIFARQQAHKI